MSWYSDGDKFNEYDDAYCKWRCPSGNEHECEKCDHWKEVIGKGETEDEPITRCGDCAYFKEVKLVKVGTHAYYYCELTDEMVERMQEACEDAGDTPLPHPCEVCDNKSCPFRPNPNCAECKDYTECAKSRRAKVQNESK